MDQYQMNPFGYSPTESGFNQFTSFSSASTYMSNQIQNVGHSRDVPIATEHKNPQMKPSPSSNSQIISFQNSDLYPNTSPQYPRTYELQDGENMKMKRSGDGGTFSRTTLHGPEHVIAERKRREKLSQRFIALSSIIPGLTKLDKASVLGDTIKYLKQLEERVKILEEEVATRTVESVIFAKKPSLQRGDGVICFSSDGKSYDPLIEQQLPEVEAQVSGKNVLIKVQCEKHKGCIKELMKQMEDMNLTTLNISVLAFGSSLLDIIIMAQIENENCLTLEEIVEKLRDALTMFLGSSSKRSAC
ncbi:transcription factor bHLH25-like [Eucalyptus grandis]|uniref:transcription factor bHLH25-like n=1 Tax=Eucalyptus grandis TaxID=71139 RepID=UPI00192EDDD5|nr:transcription factor bHLH25-like [Eucalyptus grandis]